MNDRDFEITNLKAIFDAVSCSPYFKPNPKYPTDPSSNLYINYNDVMADRYIIRCSSDYSPFNTAEGDIVAKYDSIEALVDNGWRLD